MHMHARCGSTVIFFFYRSILQYYTAHKIFHAFRLVRFIAAVVGRIKFHLSESAARNSTPNTYDNNELMNRTQSIKMNLCAYISFPSEGKCTS